MSDLPSSVRMTEVDYDPFATPELARAVPTTEPQREIWLADQLGREASLAFNESITLTMAGPLDLQSLQDTLLSLSDRHESLRSTFSADGMKMLIAPRGTLQATLVDLSALDSSTRETGRSDLKLEAVRTPFDLINGPLVRAILVRLAAESHELILTTHHIICDGWSFGVLSRDLMGLYHAFSEGRNEGALGPADSYGDYVLAGHEDARVRAADADENYWVSVFDKSVPVLDLPADRARRGRRSFASKREDLRIEPELVEAARRLGAPRGASLFATMFGLFSALMGRLGGEADLVVGVPAAGQAAYGLDALVGHCVNLLPVRVFADPAQSVDAFIRHARERVMDAYDHQGCTFGRLLSKLQLGRDASRLPLVSVQFNIDTAIRPEELSRAGLNVSLHANPREFENFELFVNASQVEGAVVLECQYNTELFDTDTVRRWLKLYRAAIQRAAAQPDQPLGCLFKATDEDIVRIAQCNRTDAEYASLSRVEELFAAQMQRTPDAVAVVAGSSSLTYIELAHRANALAAYLSERGVGEGHLVGLACGRNEHLLVGMLGILQSGAGYVPLDPAFPADRLSHMRSDAGLAWIASDSSVRDSVSTGDASVVFVDELVPVSTGPRLSLGNDGPAYVIYTSGSTGKPKGVAVPQRAVVNFLTSMAREPGLNASDRLVAVTTPSFDIAVLELLLPLSVGARVILADRDTVLDGAALKALLDEHDATVMQATPSGWRLLVDAGWMGRPGFKALVGGEALPQDLAEALLARCGELWNMYGPTETTVWSTCWKVQSGRSISIGSPIANTTVQVLDDRLEVCPVGVPGEVFIGGDGVTLGYLHRPELTAEKFLPDPYQTGARMYRTGDRGRWRNDGLLEHMGRLDFQVKVRGYRIELGEIEANLVRHRDVERAVVITREDEPGDVRLVAYVVTHSGQPLDPSVVRDFLRESLPEYMVPAHIESLHAIPLLPNGKIDRKALPKPEASRALDSTERLAPRSPLEEQVLRAMEQALNLPGLGIRDDFFGMGGHSLLAAKLTARINKDLDLNLPLRTVFESPTAEGLAQAIESARRSMRPTRSGVAHLSEQREGPLTVMQERIRFMEEMHPGRVVYNTPSAHRLTGPLDLAAFGRALNAMVQRQPSLRTYFELGASTPVQRVVESLRVEVPFEDLSELPKAEREAALMKRMEGIIDQPMPIGVAPLFRVALYRMGQQEHVFLFMPHHIIWDGWSFDLLYQEMAALYPAAVSGQPAALPPLPVTYLDYANWHAKWMAGEECRGQIEHWNKRYSNVTTARALPTDHARRAGMTGTGAVEWVHVDKELTERLRQSAQSHGVTLNMLVMSIYSAMLAQATGSRSLVLGIPVRGRLSVEVESVMGFFNNLVPAPLDIDMSLSLADWLKIIKSEMLDAFANQDVPFERLASEPEIARHANKAGLYQSLFSFQDARDRERSWGPLRHSSVLVMQKGATEDFGLWLMEVPGGMEGGINYNADLFEQSTARVFRERLLGLLRRVAESPRQTIEALLAEPGDDTSAFVAWIGAHAGRAEAVTARTDEPARRLSAREKQLAEVWSGLLGIDPEQIHAEDNFFDIGGNSLLVMQAVAETDRRIGVKIDPRRYVFEPLGKLAAAEVDGGGSNRLAAIWASLLGIEASDVRPDDNFFDLGGSSLLVMRASAEAEKQLGLKIEPSRYVYETLQQLSAGVPAQATQPESAEPEVVESTASSGLLSRVLGRFSRRG
jgi:amino acid adenylation domain-containing protein